MGFYAEPWLREARDRIKSFPDIAGDDFRADDFNKLAEAVEKARADHAERAAEAERLAALDGG